MKIGINVSYAALVTGTRSTWALFFKTLSFLSSDFERNNENFRKISVLVRLQGTTHWTAWNALLWFWTSEITGKYYKLLHIRVYTAPVYECSCVLLEYCFVQSSFLSLKIPPLIVPCDFFPISDLSSPASEQYLPRYYQTCHPWLFPPNGLRFFV